MRKLAVLSSSIALLSLVLPSLHCSPANAQVKAAGAPAAAINWTGFYIGGNVGGGWGKSSAALSPNDASSARVTADWAPQAPSFNTSGPLVGLQLGYNWQVGRNWLVGAETDFNFSSIMGDGSASSALTTFDVPTSTTADERVKWFGTVRGRLGYLPQHNLLAYVTGGLAYGRVEQNVSFNNNSGTRVITNAGGFSSDCFGNTTCFAGSSSRTAVGWTLGGGLEYAFWQNVTLKAEYLYVNLGGNDFNVTAQRIFPGIGASPASFTAQFDPTIFHVARLGVNVRF